MKPKKSKKVSRPRNTRSGSRKNRIALAILVATVLGLCGGYLFHLDREIVSRFEGKRWRLPSKIYSDTFSLYTGGPFQLSHIQNRLRRLGYQPAKQSTPRQGEYRVGSGFMDIGLHDFLYPGGPFEGFPVRIETGKGIIQRLVDIGNLRRRSIRSIWNPS